VKVDTEGWEGPALRGLGLADGKCLPKVIIIEHVQAYAQENPFMFLLKNGYECREPGSGKKLASAEAMDRKGANADFVCKLETIKAPA
jgi:hypothetical protein